MKITTGHAQACVCLRRRQRCPPSDPVRSSRGLDPRRHCSRCYSSIATWRCTSCSCWSVMQLAFSCYADAYPIPVNISAEELQSISDAGASLFFEFPSSLPNVDVSFLHTVVLLLCFALITACELLPPHRYATACGGLASS